MSYACGPETSGEELFQIRVRNRKLGPDLGGLKAFQAGLEKRRLGTSKSAAGRGERPSLWMQKNVDGEGYGCRWLWAGNIVRKFYEWRRLRILSHRTFR